MLELFRSRISCLAPILSLARTKSPKLFIRARVKPSAGQAIRVEDTNIGCGPKDKTIAGQGTAIVIHTHSRGIASWLSKLSNAGDPTEAHNYPAWPAPGSEDTKIGVRRTGNVWDNA